MVKTLRCSSCGAKLKSILGQPNMVCEYCNSHVRVGNDKASFDSTAILEQIIQIWPRVRNDDFNETYAQIKDLVTTHRYTEANRMLNRILERDSSQSRAWFYKSLLPVLDQETIIFKGCHVNVVKVSKITDRAQLRRYLKSCGLRHGHQREFINHYRSTDFLYEQQIKFLDKAIQHASTEERVKFFKNQKAEREKRQRKKLRNRFLVTWGLILLLAVVVAGGCVVVWHVTRGWVL